MTYFPISQRHSDDNLKHLKCQDCQAIAKAIALCIDIRGGIPPVGMISELLGLPPITVKEHYQEFARLGWLSETTLNIQEIPIEN